MRSVKLLLCMTLTTIFLVSCGEENTKVGNDQSEKREKEIEETVKEEVVEQEPLPFDVSEFEEMYYRKLDGFEEEKNSMKMNATDTSITLAFGNMTEALTLLNTLNDFMDDSDLETFIDEFAIEVLDSEIDEVLITDGVRIYINSTTPFDIMITVSKE